MAPVTSSLRPTIVLRGRQLHSFHLCGVVGLVLASALVCVLIPKSGLSFQVGGYLLASGVLTFLALALVSKIVTGREALVYYHHEVAVLASAALLLWLLGQPVLPYLDLNALWLGVFLACGRCGCLMAGCCHGRPHRWGVRYGEGHVAEGFPACYVGVRLFPVQVLEALAVLSIVAVGTWQLLQGWPAGTVLSTYVIGYSVARLWLEELRGDDARRYWGRFSEAQWTSLLLAAGVLLGEWQGRLPWSDWHFALGLAAAASMLVLAGVRRARHPGPGTGQASEVAGTAGCAQASPRGDASVRRTSPSYGSGLASVKRALQDGRVLPVSTVLRLQQTVGNREVACLLRSQAASLLSTEAQASPVMEGWHARRCGGAGRSCQPG